MSKHNHALLPHELQLDRVPVEHLGHCHITAPDAVSRLDPDQRDLELKYRHLAEEIVNLRVDNSSLVLQMNDLRRRIGELEAHSVLDLFTEGDAS